MACSILPVTWGRRLLTTYEDCEIMYWGPLCATDDLSLVVMVDAGTGNAHATKNYQDVFFNVNTMNYLEVDEGVTIQACALTYDAKY